MSDMTVAEKLRLRLMSYSELVRRHGAGDLFESLIDSITDEWPFIDHGLLQRCKSRLRWSSVVSKLLEFVEWHGHGQLFDSMLDGECIPAAANAPDPPQHLRPEGSGPIKIWTEDLLDTATA